MCLEGVNHQLPLPAWSALVCTAVDQADGVAAWSGKKHRGIVWVEQPSQEPKSAYECVDHRAGSPAHPAVHWLAQNCPPCGIMSCPKPHPERINARLLRWECCTTHLWVSWA